MHSARCRGVQLVTRITLKPHDPTSVFVDVVSAINDVSQCIGIGFVDDVMFSYHGASGPESCTSFRGSSPGSGTSWTSDNYSVFWRQRGRNVLSTIALL